MENPIYLEYYSHEDCVCYKIDLPYTEFFKTTIVLCKISEGEEKARYEATLILISNVLESINEDITKRNHL